MFTASLAVAKPPPSRSWACRPGGLQSGGRKRSLRSLSAGVSRTLRAGRRRRSLRSLSAWGSTALRGRGGGVLVGEAADGGVGEGEAGAVVVGEGSLVEGVGEDEVVVFFLDEGWEVGFFAEFLVLGFGEGADEGEGGGAGDAGLRVGFLEEGAEGVRCNLLVEDEDVFCGAGEGGGLGGGGELVGGEGPGDLVGGAEGFLEPAGGGEAGGGDDEVEAVFGGAGVVGEVGVEAVEAEVVEACGVEGAAEGLGGGAGREVEGGGAEDADGGAEVVRGRGELFSFAGGDGDATESTDDSLTDSLCIPVSARRKNVLPRRFFAVAGGRTFPNETRAIPEGLTNGFLIGNALPPEEMNGIAKKFFTVT